MDDENQGLANGGRGRHQQSTLCSSGGGSFFVADCLLEHRKPADGEHDRTNERGGITFSAGGIPWKIAETVFDRRRIAEPTGGIGRDFTFLARAACVACNPSARTDRGHSLSRAAFRSCI